MTDLSNKYDITAHGTGLNAAGESLTADDKFHDECGVCGYYSPDKSFDCAPLLYYGLYALQHRGQESAGITVSKDGRFAFANGYGGNAFVVIDLKLPGMGKAAEWAFY